MRLSRDYQYRGISDGQDKLYAHIAGDTKIQKASNFEDRTVGWAWMGALHHDEYSTEGPVP